MVAGGDHSSIVGYGTGSLSLSLTGGKTDLLSFPTSFLLLLGLSCRVNKHGAQSGY